MAEGRRAEEWAQTASMMALTANCHRGKKHRAFSPADFNPYAAKKDHGKFTVQDFGAIMAAKYDDFGK